MCTICLENFTTSGGGDDYMVRSAFVFVENMPLRDIYYIHKPKI